MELRVLIVDDLADDRFFLSRALGKTGVPLQVHEVEDGAEAIDFLGRQGRFASMASAPNPDLMLLDLKMPGLDGFDVLSWLARHPEVTPRHLVVLSGSELDLDIRRALELGANGYLVKPPTPAQLLQLLTLVIGQRD